jgi:2-polyprenyl-3-methyl-5-hydroxy-6-metoxy-1,4-benzoquinol methylase
MDLELIEKMYSSKESSYFSLERQMFKDAIVKSNLNILDIGCGSGILGEYFMSFQGCTVHGVEINESAYQEAKVRLTSVIKGNIETIVLPYEMECFDAIILGDVLEHLINPIELINKILPFLKRDGSIFITVPNVRHWSVINGVVLKDEWEYQDWGILDYTHLRFFTKKSLISLCNKSSAKVRSIRRVIQNPSKSYFFSKLTLGLFDGFLSSHIFIQLEK